MAEPASNNKNVSFPPILLAVHAIAMVGTGLAIAEIIPKHDHNPGLIPADLQWPLLWVSILVAVFATGKMIAIIRQHSRQSQDPLP